MSAAPCIALVRSSDLPALLGDIQAGRLGRADLLDPSRPPSNTLALALLLEFERQTHDVGAHEAVCRRLDGATARTSARTTLSFLMKRCTSPQGQEPVRDAGLEVWATFADCHRYGAAAAGPAEGLFAAIADLFRPTVDEAKAAFRAGFPRRAARLFKWLLSAGDLPDSELTEYVKTLSFVGDPAVYWSDLGDLPPDLQGKKDAAGVANLSLGIRNSLELQAQGRANRAWQREQQEIARAQLELGRANCEISRQILELNRRLAENQDRLFKHLDRSDAFELAPHAGEGEPAVTLKDVKGIDEVTREVAVIVEFLSAPETFTRLGGRIPKGVLIVGPPGTGKTLLARAIAGDAKARFYALSGSDFVEVYVGVGASRVRSLFERARANPPAIVFIDEIDAIGRRRGDGNSPVVHEEREQTLNQLLVELDGFESTPGVIVIAATNRPDILDPALLRPGRFDRRIVVPYPDSRGRAEILAHHVARRGVPLADDVRLAEIARGVTGFSGADLENLINEAALLAALAGCSVVRADHFLAAREKLALGVERRSLLVSEKERRTTACHEAGHALLAFVLPDADPVEKVSIVPRGRVLGQTWQVSPEDRFNITRAEANDAIAVALGGRVAEELLLEQPSSGAKKDLEDATSLARRMVCEWGMSERLGPLSLVPAPGSARFAFGQESPEYSEKTAAAIDEEVRRLVLENHQRATSLLKERRPQLEALVQALLERETLDHADVMGIVDGHSGQGRSDGPSAKAAPAR